MTETQLPPTAPPTMAVWECVLGIAEQATQAASLDLTGLETDDVGGLLVAREEAVRRLAVLDQALIRQVVDRGIPAEHGCSSPVSYLKQLLRIRAGEAKARVKAVERFQPRTQLSGEVLPPRFPAVAAALAAGEISLDHADVIASSLERLPAAVPVEAREATETHLVDCARDWNPTAVQHRATYLEAVLDPDGRYTTEAEQIQRRELSISKTNHGMWRLTGLLDPEAANVVQVALGPLSRPVPGPGDERDPRPAGRRRADALVQIAQWSLNHPKMPTHGNRKPQIVATVTLRELQSRVGVARLNNGEPLSIPRLLQKAGEMALAVFGHRGEVLHYGRTQRTAPAALRKALEARDRGCAFPGCDAPALWTEAHHVRWWSEGGTTDIESMGLYCKHHHQLNHRGHWDVRMIDGIPTPSHRSGSTPHNAHGATTPTTHHDQGGSPGSAESMDTAAMPYRHAHTHAHARRGPRAAFRMLGQSAIGPAAAPIGVSIRCGCSRVRATRSLRRIGLSPGPGRTTRSSGPGVRSHARHRPKSSTSVPHSA